MGFLRPKRVHPGGAVAEAALHLGSDEMLSALVTGSGNEDLLVQLPALYFDWMLVKYSGDEEANMLGQVEGLMNAVRIDPDNVPDLELFRLVDSLEEEPWATVQTVVSPSLRLDVSFRPRSRIVKAGSLAFPVYWKWVANEVLGGEHFRILALAEQVLEQCAYYRRHGAPAGTAGRAIRAL